MSPELDPQARAFLDALDAQRAPPTHGSAVETARAGLEAVFSVGDPEAIHETMDFEIGGPDGPLPVRLYAPETDGPLPVFVFFHGGGWVLGGLETHDAVCRAVANAADCLVLAVDYRLAPEHPFPAAVEDCYAATEWAAAFASDIGGDPDRIAVGGDSAGGNLTAAVTLMTQDRDGPELSHQSLIYPAVNSPALHAFDSYEENAEGYFLERAEMEWFYERYAPRAADARNEYLAPLLARDLSGVPPATLITAGFDPLRDEGFAYADRLDEAGVALDHEHFEGMIHGFINMLDPLDRSHDAIEVVASGLRDSFDT